MEKINSGWVITCNNNEYKLSEPNFDVYALAWQKYLTGTMLSGGQIIFDACYTGGDIESIKENIKLYASLCLQAAKIIDFFEADIKKN